MCVCVCVCFEKSQKVFVVELLFFSRIMEKKRDFCSSLFLGSLFAFFLFLASNQTEGHCFISSFPNEDDDENTTDE